MSNSNQSIQTNANAIANAKMKSAQYELSLLKSSALLGVKNAPDIHMLSALSSFVFKYYKHFTSEDVEEAFRYGASNGIEHYGSFDMQYVARCMNSYRHIVESRVKREQERQASHLLDRVPEMTDKDAYEYLLKYYEKNNELPMIFCWSKAFIGLVNTLPIDKGKAYVDEARANAEHYQILLKAETHSDYRGKETFIVRQLVDRITIEDGEREAQKQIVKRHILQ
jgi:hypothetical protein